MIAWRPQPRSIAVTRSAAPNRTLFLGGTFAVWAICLVGKLYYLQVIKYRELANRAERQQQRTVEIAPERGTIFDRHAHPLAMSVAVDSIYAVPTEIPDHALVSHLLASILSTDCSELEEHLNAFKAFCWVRRKVSDEESTRVRQLNLRGIYFQREMKRFYPKGELASHVLGYVGMDDNGLAGLEFGMNEAVKGRPSKVFVAADARHQSFHSKELEGKPGKNVVLTLDENVQYIAEKVLAETVAKWHAAGGTVILQNPTTGEILAMANVPSINANDFARSRAQSRVNRAVNWIYEPGSTFKLVTLSAALEENLTRPHEVIDCQMGKIALAGHTIHDHQRFGALTVADVLAKSSDVGAIKLGLRLGAERFYRYIRSFGFGSKTNIELPGEERGLLKPPNRWSGISIGSISMGQEIGVTPLQIVSAYSAIANGGMLFQPRIVRDIYRRIEHDPLPPAVGHRVVSDRVAGIMRELLAGVVEHGTGKPAKPDGYSAAGKTGTAQKIDSSGRYSRSHYVASFVGFAPVERPMVTILVVIDSPVGQIYGAEVAAPAFRSIAEQTLGYLRVSQETPSARPLVASPAPAAFPRQVRGKVAASPSPDSENVGAASSLFPPARAVSYRSLAPRTQQIPERPKWPSGPADAGIMLISKGPLLTIPDFTGWSVRSVAEKCQALGLDLNIRGSGIAVSQSPAEGAKVPVGSDMAVQFSR
jgi:cell division protein FtsI (penicillin-binding protein 3)